MPSAEELEQMLDRMEDHLDPMEISRLHQMIGAAEIMDARDKEDADGHEERPSELG